MVDKLQRGLLTFYLLYSLTQNIGLGITFPPLTPIFHTPIAINLVRRYKLDLA